MKLKENEITKACFVDFSQDRRFFKSAEVSVGTIKVWSDGKKYQKQADGSWKEYNEQKQSKEKK